MFSVILEVIMKRNICFFEPDEKLAGKLIDYWLDHGLIGYISAITQMRQDGWQIVSHYLRSCGSWTIGYVSLYIKFIQEELYGGLTDRKKQTHYLNIEVRQFYCTL
jgi:hypothetical protein